MPVLAYALETQTYGVRPAKMPMPPRTCWLPPTLGCQLKPMRGENHGRWLAVLDESRAILLLSSA